MGWTKMNKLSAVFCTILVGLSLSACGNTASTTVVQKLIPPFSLMQDCKHAKRPSDTTNGGLAQALQSERNALDVCNTQLGALRTWAGKSTE